MKTKTTLAISLLAICLFAAIPAALAQDTTQGSNDGPKLSPKMAARAQELLPGKDPQEAYAGFRSPTDFFAAAHTAQNLSLNFDDIKAQITKGASLTSVIQQLKPDAKAKDEADKAMQQAREDVRGAGQPGEKEDKR
jgi:hypothetical protein